MNTWTPQTGVKYSGLSTSPPKKKKKNKKKCTREAYGRKTGKRKERRFGTPREKKKKSEPK